ncbi:MAG: hypothetical protein GY839_13985 [candidate division Zixibacteria bacterium]|nr:hypothetical protein [candidate division Zixibacteria bacterium]
MLRLLIIIIMILPSALWAQVSSDPTLIYEMATENNVFVGARAAGMAGAQIAAADDGSALWYNPALLTRIRRLELSGTLSHQRFFNETRFDAVNTIEAQLNKTRLSSLWGVFPVPVEQGGLSFAMAANRIKNFDRIFRFENTPGWFAAPSGDGLGGGEDDRGSLWAYSIGAGVEMSTYTSIGIALEWYGGVNDYSYLDDEIVGPDTYSYRQDLKNSYSGYSTKIGLAYSSGPNFHLGATIKPPTVLKVEQENYQVSSINGSADSDYSTGEYKFHLPFSFGVGVLYTIRDLLITGDLIYTDFTQLEYKEGVDLFEANSDIKKYYNDVVTLNLGAEYFIPQWGLMLRGGYSRDPIPYNFYPVEDDLSVFTAGFGFLLDKTLKLDVAANFLNWTRKDNEFFGVGTVEKYRAQRVFLGITYRI